MEVGLGHGCAPVDQGVRCWGTNTAGQAPPELVPLGGQPTSIAVGAEHSCAVTRAGNVLCWGASGRGQIGLPPAIGRAPRIVADDAARAWALPGATCYSTQSGEFRCAGNGEDYCAVPTFATVRGLTEVSEVFTGPNRRSVRSRSRRQCLVRARRGMDQGDFGRRDGHRGVEVRVDAALAGGAREPRRQSRPLLAGRRPRPLRALGDAWAEPTTRPRPGARGSGASLRDACGSRRAPKPGRLPVCADIGGRVDLRDEGVALGPCPIRLPVASPPE